jgi:predicted lysophospholipase L1 biosynthesis ABC-type transport system permease subunit
MTLRLSKGQDREALQEFDGVEHEVRRAIRPRVPEAQDDLPLRGEAEPVLRHRRSQGVPTELLETLPRVGGDAHVRMEFESLLAGVMARGGRDLVLLPRLAALLCGLGLFGMMNFHVVTRQRELGVRLVLGAERRSIQWSVVREAVFVILAGTPVGLAAYFASHRVVGSFLFDLSPTDAPTIAAAASLLVLVAVAASVIPARRATQLDPAVILRRE